MELKLTFGSAISGRLPRLLIFGSNISSLNGTLHMDAVCVVSGLYVLLCFCVF